MANVWISSSFLWTALSPSRCHWNLALPRGSWFPYRDPPWCWCSPPWPPQAWRWEGSPVCPPLLCSNNSLPSPSKNVCLWLSRSCYPAPLTVPVIFLPLKPSPYFSLQPTILAPAKLEHFHVAHQNCWFFPYFKNTCTLIPWGCLLQGSGPVLRQLTTLAHPLGLLAAVAATPPPSPSPPHCFLLQLQFAPRGSPMYCWTFASFSLIFIPVMSSPPPYPSWHLMLSYYSHSLYGLELPQPFC